MGRGDRSLPAGRAEAQAAIPGSTLLLRNPGEAGRALGCLRALLQKVWRSRDKSAALGPFLLTFQGGVRRGVPCAPVGSGLPAASPVEGAWAGRGLTWAVHIIHTRTPGLDTQATIERPAAGRPPSPRTGSPWSSRCQSKRAPQPAPAGGWSWAPRAVSRVHTWVLFG